MQGRRGTVLAVALAALLAAGCGDDERGAADTSTSSASTTPSASTTSTEAEPTSTAGEEGGTTAIPPLEAEPAADPGEWRSRAGRICLRTLALTETARRRFDRLLGSANNLAAKSRETATYQKVLAEIFRREVAQIAELPVPPELLDGAEAYAEIEMEFSASLLASAELWERPTLQFSPRRAEALEREQDALKRQAAEARDELGLRACS